MVCLAMLAGCGGSDGSGGSGGSQSNIRATSSATTLKVTSAPVVTLYEGSTSAFYTITSSGGSGTGPTYSISGTDAARFNVNASTGAISFKAAPSYSSPTDADADNEYLITVTVNRGGTTASQALSVQVVQNVGTRAYSWANAPFAGGGFITGLLYHPSQANLLYARTDVGGVYRWDSANSKWIALNDDIDNANSQQLGVVSMAVDPNNVNKLYLATGQYLTTNPSVDSWMQTGSILRSSDKGATWQRTSLPIYLGGNADGRGTGERLQVDPNNSNILYLGTNQDGLWKSTDAGVTWAKVSAFTPGSCTFVTFDKRTVSGGVTSIIYVGVNTTSGISLYRSTDGGATWAAVSNAPSGLIPHHAKFDSNGVLYVTYSNALGPNGSTTGAVYKYVTSTSTWTNITPAAPTSTVTFGYSGLATDTLKPGVIEVSTIDRWSTNDDIYRSTDGGATWTALNAKSTHANGGHPWVTAYSGGSITKMGHWIDALEIDPFNSANAVYGTGFGLFMTSNGTAADSGGTVAWTFADTGIEETVPQMLKSPTSGPHLFASMGDVGGATYSTLDSSDINGFYTPPATTSHSVDYMEKRPTTVVRTSDGASKFAYISTDSGSTWTMMAASPVQTGHASGTIVLAPRGTSMLWVPGDQPGYYSTNSGASWTASSGYPVYTYTDGSGNTVNSGYTPVADRFADGYYYAYDYRNGVLYESSNGGVSFASVVTGLPTWGGVPISLPWYRRDLWFPLNDGGLLHIDGPTATPTYVTSVQSVYAISYGAPAPGVAYPSLYISGKVNGVRGIFRSDDKGVTWVRINEDSHQYGWIQTISGDPRAWGRVYLGTSGRGVVVGNR